MTHQQIISYCLKKHGAYIDYPFGEDYTVIKVKAPSQPKGRIFAQIFELKGKPKVTLNCSPDTADFYRSIYPGTVVRGWHCPPVMHPYFNTIDIGGTVPDEEVLRMIDHSYGVVVSKLPKYIQRELKGENGDATA